MLKLYHNGVTVESEVNFEEIDQALQELMVATKILIIHSAEFIGGKENAEFAGDLLTGGLIKCLEDFDIVDAIQEDLKNYE